MSRFRSAFSSDVAFLRCVLALCYALVPCLYATVPEPKHTCPEPKHSFSEQQYEPVCQATAGISPR